MGILEKRRKMRESVIRKSLEWVSSLPFKLTAILIGSYARGDFNLWSDVDILLISREFKGNPVERLMSIDFPAGFQVIPLTEKEFKILLKRRESLILEAKEKGVILRDDLKLFSKDSNEN